MRHPGPSDARARGVRRRAARREGDLVCHSANGGQPATPEPARRSARSQKHGERYDHEQVGRLDHRVRHRRRRSRPEELKVLFADGTADDDPVKRVKLFKENNRRLRFVSYRTTRKRRSSNLWPRNISPWSWARSIAACDARTSFTCGGHTLTSLPDGSPLRDQRAARRSAAG